MAYFERFLCFDVALAHQFVKREGKPGWSPTAAAVGGVRGKGRLFNLRGFSYERSGDGGGNFT